MLDKEQKIKNIKQQLEVAARRITAPQQPEGQLCRYININNKIGGYSVYDVDQFIEKYSKVPLVLNMFILRDGRILVTNNHNEASLYFLDYIFGDCEDYHEEIVIKRFDFPHYRDRSTIHSLIYNDLAWINTRAEDPVLSFIDYFGLVSVSQRKNVFNPKAVKSQINLPLKEMFGYNETDKQRETLALLTKAQILMCPKAVQLSRAVQKEDRDRFDNLKKILAEIRTQSPVR